MRGGKESFRCGLLLLFARCFGGSDGIGAALGLGSQLEASGSHCWAHGS